MIRPLRRVHLVLWLVLAVILVVGFSAGLRARKKPAVMEIPRALR